MTGALNLDEFDQVTTLAQDHTCIITRQRLYLLRRRIVA